MKNGHISSDSASSGVAATTCGNLALAALSCMNEPAAHNTNAKSMV